MTPFKNLNIMKTQTPKKLFAFIVTVMMFSFSIADAQIVYTDLNPDVFEESDLRGADQGEYLLDLNNDGIMDFLWGTYTKFIPGCTTTANLKSGNVIRVTALNNNAASGLKLALNAVIDGNTPWISSQELRRSTVNPDD